MTSKPTLSVTDALARLRAGDSLDEYSVSVTEPLDAVAAFHLRKAGVAVPDSLITYHDADLEADEESDGQAWTRLHPVPLTLQLPAEVADWLATVPAERLVGKLVEDFWRLRELVE